MKHPFVNSTMTRSRTNRAKQKSQCELRWIVTFMQSKSRVRSDEKLKVVFHSTYLQQRYSYIQFTNSPANKNWMEEIWRNWCWSLAVLYIGEVACGGQGVVLLGEGISCSPSCSGRRGRPRGGGDPVGGWYHLPRVSAPGSVLQELLLPVTEHAEIGEGREGRVRLQSRSL